MICFLLLIAPASYLANLLSVQVLLEYSAGILNREYTIRSIPADVDKALRLRAREEAKSLNTVVVEALARGLELDVAPRVLTDLDELSGSWQEDPVFDQAMDDLQKIDNELWE